MYYLQSRYYNPEWGRFINADAIVGQTGVLLGHNMFAYCLNNPINRDDPNGYWSFRSFTKNALLGIAVVAAAVVVVAAVATLTVTTGGLGTLALLGTASTIGANAAMVGATAVVGYGLLEAQDLYLNAKERSADPPAKRKRFSSKKKAYEKAKREGGGREPVHHPDGEHGPHFHPDVKMPKDWTPKKPNPHDHYYYPRSQI